jgi:hypothetical protein
LKKWTATPEAAPFKSFYDEKLARNGEILAVYESRSSEEAKAGFFATSKGFIESLKHFINNTLPTYLPGSEFIGGERPGEADFHAGAWLARIAATQGGKLGEDGINVLEKELGGPVDPKIVKYWIAWSGRESWKSVYADGLH